MTIRINAQELYELLRLTPPTQNIMLIGRHGIGKSEIITHFYRQQGQRVVAFFLGQMSDPGDLIGLLHKDEASGRSLFLPPYWWPEPDEPIVLFLDELNRARPEILQAVHDLALNKRLAGKELPVGSMVIAAVNEGDEYQLTELDPALVSRFNLYEFAPTVEEWLVWASAHAVDERVVAFIQKNHHHLDGERVGQEEAMQHAGLVKLPDRRSWVRVSDFIKSQPTLGELAVKAIAGMVGVQAALAFHQSLLAAAKLSVEQVLLHFSRHRAKLKEMTLQEIVLLNEQMMLWINSKRYAPDDADTIRTNLLAYLKALKQLKNQEAVAHFASLLEQPQYDHASNFVAEALDIILFLTDYVQGIQV
ncbi:MAG: AAA family ATPase [Caldilineaceae bacterium]